MSRPNHSIQLHPEHPVLNEADLHFFPFEEGESNSCFLILPGGGYGMVSHREWEIVAAWFNTMGISAAVLDYTVGEKCYPRPQQQGLYAMRYLRSRAEELNIDPNRIGAMGFSAGGHLAASLSCGFGREDWLLDPDSDLSETSARPDLAILSYPVISSGPKGHQGSFANLLGKASSASEREALSMDKLVSEETPSTFLWHTAEDKAVPVENSYLYAMALQSKGVAHELHVFPKGVHGLSMGVSPGGYWNPYAKKWMGLAEDWLRAQGF